MIVTDERVARFVGERMGTEFVPPFTAIGLERHGGIVAGAVFNHWTGFDIHLSIASEPGAITRDLLRAWGRYVRDVCQCERVTMVTEQLLVVSMAQRLGGQIEGRLRNHFGPGRDGVLLGILKSEWRF